MRRTWNTAHLTETPAMRNGPCVSPLQRAAAHAHLTMRVGQVEVLGSEAERRRLWRRRAAVVEHRRKEQCRIIEVSLGSGTGNGAYNRQ
jgi:hypothetical protein